MERKTELIQTMVTPTLFSQTRNAAEYCNVSPSEFIRAAITEKIETMAKQIAEARVNDWLLSLQRMGVSDEDITRAFKVTSQAGANPFSIKPYKIKEMVDAGL